MRLPVFTLGARWKKIVHLKAVAEQIKQRVLEQFTTSPGNVSNTTKHNKNHTHPGAIIVDKDIVDKDARYEVLNTNEYEETYKRFLTLVYETFTHRNCQNKNKA